MSFPAGGDTPLLLLLGFGIQDRPLVIGLLSFKQDWRMYLRREQRLGSPPRLSELAVCSASIQHQLLSLTRLACLHDDHKGLRNDLKQPQSISGNVGNLLEHFETSWHIQSPHVVLYFRLV